ncbi:unnamed protein product [Closterium sp. NIES-64]|nr:unnamed protein product [Closterium sp. NIES-64]
MSRPRARAPPASICAAPSPLHPASSRPPWLVGIALRERGGRQEDTPRRSRKVLVSIRVTALGSACDGLTVQDGSATAGGAAMEGGEGARRCPALPSLNCNMLLLPSSLTFFPPAHLPSLPSQPLHSPSSLPYASFLSPPCLSSLPSPLAPCPSPSHIERHSARHDNGRARSTSAAAICADALISALNVAGFSCAATPAATELEEVVMDWMVDLLGLPHGFLMRHHLAGVHLADSLVSNVHKWLLTSFDCCCMWTQVVLHVDAGSVACGRRSLKLWMLLRTYGVEGIRAYITRHVALAEWFEEAVRQDERFQIVAMGDEEMRRRGVHKSGGEGRPACVPSGNGRWTVHRCLAATGDALLSGKALQVMRQHGEVWVDGNVATASTVGRTGIGSSNGGGGLPGGSSAGVTRAGSWDDQGSQRD